jgi:hypothetical protein
MSGSARMGLTDDALLGWLGRLAEDIDPVPAEVCQSASAAFALRDLDAELAELVDDSLARPDALAGVRGDADTRMLFFQAGEVGFELQVTRLGTRYAVLGQLVGGWAAEAQVQSPDRTRTAVIDELGRFDFEVPRGPCRLSLVRPGRPPVTTDWLLF